MDDFDIMRGKSKHRVSDITNEHYFRVDVFYGIIDMLMEELDNQFSETTSNLLIGMACMDPSDSFSAFDKSKILRMARYYPDDFDESSTRTLGCELDTFFANLQDDERFSDLHGIGELSVKLVQTKKHMIIPILHLLLKLALLLPVSITTVERFFSAMKHIKIQMRNKISYEFLNDTVTACFEDDLFPIVTNDDIMHRFQNMKIHRGQLY